MADKKHKSQAEKVAASKSHGKKTTKTGKNEIKYSDVPKERAIPVRLISSAIFFSLFTVFLIISLYPEGELVLLLEKIVHGLIGRAGFLVSIPGFLYLFVIHAFSGKRPVKMRSVCVAVFITVCGCFFHLTLSTQNLSSGWKIIGDLYAGGIDGTTGGVICGSIAAFIQWLCGTVISYIIYVLVAVFSLLGAMQITVSSIIRAIQNRPRPEWKGEEKIERQEPAAVVVNHIANKRIEHIEHQRERKARQAEEKAAKAILDESSKKETQEVSKKEENSKVADMMRQIDFAVDIPSVSSSFTAEKTEQINSFLKEEEEIVPQVKEEVAEQMPVFERESVIVEAQPAPIQKVKPEKVTAKDSKIAAEEVFREIETAKKETQPEYCFPPIDLLKLPGNGSADGTAEMRDNTRRLNETLASFKIEAHIINVTRGPSVTRYEVELEKGVRLNKLTTAADDIALSLGATGVRIAAVPGKISVVGIEVPNKAVTMVSLREVIDSQEFSKAKSKSSFAVGKDIGGNCIIGNISRLPHMLIAGTTGSGKSVCMNSIIISLLYKASPEDVKLIMVDPKMVELGIYNGIPHLLIPVVTDPKKAAGSLQWAVSEMMRRYKAMSDAGVRDLESYNSIVEGQETDNTKLPQVVVIIDELADLMLVAAKEVEESICRIAQMGRAAGIHLIIATQRPSADVITGLMKANIPSRIAFAVASAMESRIILDTQGAEKLVGKGDMLYAPIGNGKPKRVQGCFVSDSEVEAVASYVKANFVTNYDQDVMEEIERKAVQTGNKPNASDPEPNADELSGDEMLPAAVDVIFETGQASVSMLQRRLKLGYARAARIVDEMEDKGIVGPFQGSKPREILITKEQWQSMRSGNGEQMGFSDLNENAAFENSDDISD